MNHIIPQWDKDRPLIIAHSGDVTRGRPEVRNASRARYCRIYEK